MTQTDFLALLDALAAQCTVQPSELVEDSVDIEVDDASITVQWNDELHQIELTIPVPMAIDNADSDAARLMLFRTLLERQWVEAGGEDGVSFGVIPESDTVAGMVTLDGDDFIGPDAFLQLLQEAMVAVLSAWYEVCERVLLQQVNTPAAAPAGGAPFPMTPIIQA